MPASRVQRCIGVLLALMFLVGIVWMGIRSSRAADFPEADISLVEHSSDIFVGRIDIVTALQADATEYTVLTTEILKGDLQAQSLIVVRQKLTDDGETAALLPGQTYILFSRYVPIELRYELVAADSGNPPIESGEQRTELVGYWSSIIKQYTCAVTDILVLDGAVFGRRDWTIEEANLDLSEVGPSIATVELQDTSATGCRSDLSHGTTSEIPAGTKIHELRQFATTFRVAVRSTDESWYLYEVLWSATAATGADLYDIRDRVTQIEIEPWPEIQECHDMSMCLDIPDMILQQDSDLAAFVESILASPVDTEDIRYYRIGEPASGFIVFVLDDFSTVRIDFNPETGRLANGLTLPPEILDQMPSQ